MDMCLTCGKDVETCDSFGNDYTMIDGCVTRCTKYIMSEKEAKRIIVDDPDGNIVKRMEAIAVARSILGEDCTMEEVWKWAEGGNHGKEKA